jgi:glycerate 2-kinase
MTDQFAQLRDMFERAMHDVDVPSAVEKEIVRAGEYLQLGGLRCRVQDLDRVLIVAVGKAANQMYLGSLRGLQASLPDRCVIDAVVISPAPPPARENTIYCYGAHPTPDIRSVHAADIVTRKLEKIDGRTAVLFLVSGGASSMIERPLDSSIPIAEVAEFYRLLIDSGLVIEEMNILRKYISAVKGGRLAYLARHAFAVSTLVVSDVPSGSLASVGSGPSIPYESNKLDCLRIFERLEAEHPAPPAIVAFFRSDELIETPRPNDVAFCRSASKAILSSDDLASAARSAANEAGFYVVVDNICDEWDYASAGRYLLHRACNLRKAHDRFCLISVGEVTVQVNGPSGCGGRNQQFALWCAIELHRQNLDFTVLSAGSDGIDGRSPAAGAIVDRTTCERAKRLGLNAEQSLKEFDAYTIFHALEDTLGNGPTGNNVRDLRIVLSA